MIISFLSAAIVAGTPLLFATLGELLTEKSGNLNLGVEGMMLMGAVMGFSMGYQTSNPYIALLGAIIAGAIGACIYAFVTITLRGNQVVSGLTLTIFGTGFSKFVGQRYMGEVIPPAIKEFFTPFQVPFLGKIPFIGSIFFNHDVFVYLGYICAIGLGIYIYNTGRGLNLRAVGEDPSSADASGVNITLYKYVHTLLGGALCGLGGAYLSLVYIPSWQENVTAGRGWIAVALVIFVVWNPYRALLGSYLFGGLDIVGFRLQALDIKIPQHIIDMLPYVATILVLVVGSIKNSKENSPPTSLGNSYFREER